MSEKLRGEETDLPVKPEKDRERLQPVRKYSTLSDDLDEDFMENHKDIETF